MQRTYQLYFGLLGTIVLLSGTLEVLAGVAGHTLTCPLVSFAGGAFRGLWGGLVMLFAGGFLLSGIRDFGEVHRLARLLMGIILLWIMAGTDLFALLAAAIPSPDPDRWLNSLAGMARTLAPPYSMAVILLPFSLVIIPCLRRYRLRDEE